MPAGKGTYGKQRGRPPLKKKKIKKMMGKKVKSKPKGKKKLIKKKY